MPSPKKRRKDKRKKGKRKIKRGNNNHKTKQNKQNKAATQRSVRKCANCSKQNVSSVCGGCKMIYYCNKQCQTSHWKKKHKKTCTLYHNIKNIIDSGWCDFDNKPFFMVFAADGTLYFYNQCDPQKKRYTLE